MYSTGFSFSSTQLPGSRERRFFDALNDAFRRISDGFHFSVTTTEQGNAVLSFSRDGAEWISADACGAGIDLGLVIASELFGEEIAQEIQLAIEYDPAPPFASGSPRTAPAQVSTAVLRNSAMGLAERTAIVERIASRS